jgi:hypothetical protein
LTVVAPTYVDIDPASPLVAFGNPCYEANERRNGKRSEKVKKEKKEMNMESGGVLNYRWSQVTLPIRNNGAVRRVENTNTVLHY